LLVGGKSTDGVKVYCAEWDIRNWKEPFLLLFGSVQVLTKVVVLVQFGLIPISMDIKCHTDGSRL